MTDTSYIERNDAIDVMNAAERCLPADDVVWLQSLIKKLPEADVRPVVLCRDCIYSQLDRLFGGMWCTGKNMHGKQVRGGFFCADGERSNYGGIY